MKTPVAIIGGGPGGAASAMFLAREGIPSVIIEKEPFPRYHIGESMSGECGGVMRDLGLEQTLLARQFPVKTGLTVWGTGGKNSWYVPVMMRTPEWQLKEIFTWQIRRSDFDQLLLEEAVARGAQLIHGQATKPLVGDDGAVRGVQVRLPNGKLMEIESELLLDVSGQATFLANAGVTGPKYLGAYDKQIAIFSQVANTIRFDGSSREKNPDDTLIFYKSKFHWAWFIPLDRDVVSVGIVSPAAYFLAQRESKADYLRRELRELNPELSSRIPDLTLVEEARSIKNYSYQVKGFTGKGFICVGDAHRFIDPIFSFGLYVTVKEAQQLAPVVRDYLGGKNREAADPFRDYRLQFEKGIDILEDMIDTFWEHPLAFATFMHVRYRELMIDIFAGRLYERQPSAALIAMRNLLQRERPYDNDDLYSVPIGSRFHPERAALWEEQAELEALAELAAD